MAGILYSHDIAPISMDILYRFAVLDSFNDQSWMNLHFWEVFWVLVQSVLNWGGMPVRPPALRFSVEDCPNNIWMNRKMIIFCKMRLSLGEVKMAWGLFGWCWITKMLDGLNEFTLALIEVFVFWFRKLKEFKLSLTKEFKWFSEALRV